MEYREQKTPEEIRAMPPGEFLDWLKKPCGPRDDHAPTTPRVMGEGQKKAHNSPKTRTPILISAMRLLSWDIQSDDGVANAAIAEAADRLAEYWGWLEHANSVIECLKDGVMPTETANAYLEWRDFFEKQSWSKLGSP